MHYGVRSDRFPRMMTYAQAVSVEASKQAFSKGKNKGLKPLAERRRTWLTIRKDNDVVIVRMYSTDIIKYLPDNTIIINQGGWASASTHETIGAILRTTVYRKHKKDWITCHGIEAVLLDKNADNLFRKCEQNDYELVPIKPKLPVVHILDRKVYNKIAEPYKQFIKYAVGATKLRGSCKYDWSEMQAVFPNLQTCTEYDVIKHMDNEDDYYKALLLVYRQIMFNSENPVKEVKRIIAEVIKRVHRDKVFITKEVTTGRAVKDSNGHFFLS